MTNLKDMAFTQKRRMLFLLFSSVIIGAAIVGQGYLIVKIVDGVFIKEMSFSAALPLLAMLLLVLLVRTLFTYFSGRTGIKMAAKGKSYFRKELLNKYTRSPLQLSLEGQSGKKASIMIDAVDGIDSYFSQYIPQIIQTSFTPLLILIVAITQHVNTALIMMITAPFIPIFMIIIGLQTKKKSEEQLEKLSTFSGDFLDTLQGLTTLKLFGQAKQQKDIIEKNSLGFRDATMEILKVAFTSSFMLELISMLSIGIIALEVAIQLIIYKSISFFTAFFVLVLAPEFYSSLKQLGSTFHNGRSSKGAAQKVMDELSGSNQAIEWGNAVLPKDTEPPTVALQNTSYSYGEHQFTLTDISTEIVSYEQVAIVGRSGSGKTTLLHLIAGLIPPSEGSVLINNKFLSDYQEIDWFDQLCYISQNPYIFSGTIAENIAIGGKSDSTLAQVEQAAKEAGIDELVQSLGSGYDTPVGEAGRGFSGGEKQRIAIARAFLKKPSIILFDEPTTGLDLETEQILQSSLEQLSKNATVITVAHRLHTIKNADKILFLENGILIAVGTHDELIDQVPEYRDMVSVQQGGVTE